MGFDNECIVNIQSLAGEYFCPVCRLLVYPNEAIQSQCTHLYCKPCLTYVVGTTRACPYDGYLVTEADSKPLIESNKALAETIGNIAVHCLYHRSGCTWQGPLSECTSHCSGCAFGNSPVVCNRCGVQIVHRQVQEHAQTCPGVQPQTQQALSASDTSATGTATAADPSQAAAQSVTPSSQAQTTQATVAPPPGQDPNQQSSGNPQAQAVAPAAAPTPEQWYQQQYQQYYQQYPGYDPYQQTYQHSYPYQQQAVQPYQQHAQHVQGQHQPQVYTQPQAQPPLQPQPQAQVQPQVQPQSQSQSQSQPHAPPQPHQNIQVPVAAQHQNQAQGNLQQQVHPPIQMQSQTHAPPHGHPHTQPHPQSYPQGQPLPHLVQMPQYQQPPPQMQHPQPPIQPQHHSLPQPPAHSLGQPQGHVQHQPHSHPQINPPLQPNQPPNTNAHPQTQQPSVHTVTGHQSYPQPQAVQQIQLGAPQHPVQVQGGPPPQHPTQLHNQFPQQPPQLRPPQSHTPIQNQQHSALLPLQGQPGQQMLHPHSQQPGQPVQQRPVMQPIQPPVPQQFMQQQPFPGQTSGPVQNQLHQQAHLTPPPPPPPMQSHLRPPPHSYMQSQQNVIHAPQPQQSQNYIGRPMMSNHGAQSQPFPQPTSGFTGPAQVRPMQFGANPQSANLNHLPRTNNQPLVSSEQQNFQSGMALKPPMFERQGDHMSKSVAEREAGLPSQITAKTDANGLVPIGVGADKVEARTLKSEVDLKFSESEQKPRGGDKHGTQHVDTLAKDTDSKLHAVENGSGEPAIKSMVKKEGTEGTVEPSLGGSATVVKEQKDSTDFPKLADQSDSLEEHSDKLPKDAVDESMPVSTGADKGSHDIPLAHARVPDSSVHDVAPQGNSQTTPTGRDPLQHGFQERNMFQSQIAPQGPGVDEPRGFPPQGHGFPHQQPPMHYGPPTHQQRPAAPPLRPLHQGYGPAQPPSMLRPQVPGEFSHPGPPLNPADHFQTPMKQPYGSFPPEVPSGGNLGPGSTSSFGRGPTHFGPPQGNFELESSAPLGHYNHGRGPPSHVGGGPPPGSFDPHGGIMGRVPPHGPDGQFVQQRPNSQMEAEMFPDQRSRNFDGRRIDSHLPGTWEKGPLGQPPGIDSNAMRMKLAPGIDSSSTLGYGDERFKPPPEEQFNPFPLEPARRLERGSRPHDKAPFGDNYDASSGGAPSRFLPSYHSPGTFHPNEAGERVRPFGPDDNFGRADNSRTHPDFLKPAAGFGRHHMDRLTPRSPGREYPSIPPRGFGGVPRRQSGVDDIDGGQSRPFGEGFHGSRFPLSPSHLRRGDHDGPGILRGGDFTEQDILPSHLRRGEMLSHQNLPGHLRFGDPSGFGVFPSGPGNLPHSFPPGESFGGKKSSHPRLGEPGFRSSYSLQGFPNDGGFFTSNMDSIDNSRKRKPTSMGWCRICRVDCETVEGLDMHSQTREHQKKTMDMVLSIKQQNAKRQKKSNDRSAREEASKSRGAVYEGRGNKA